MPGLTLHTTESRIKSLRWRLEDADIDFNPTLTEQEVLTWEREHSVRLPAAYRLFLIEIGNGGTTHINGPAKEGLLPLNTLPKQYPLSQAEQDENLKRPFPPRVAYGIPLQESQNTQEVPQPSNSESDEPNNSDSDSDSDSDSGHNLFGNYRILLDESVEAINSSTLFPHSFSVEEDDKPPPSDQEPQITQPTNPSVEQEEPLQSQQQQQQQQQQLPPAYDPWGSSSPSTIHNGTLVLGTHANLHHTYLILVVYGPARGEIWVRSPTGVRPLYECERHESGRIGFLEWMEDWVKGLEEEERDRSGSEEGVEWEDGLGAGREDADDDDDEDDEDDEDEDDNTEY